MQVDVVSSRTGGRLSPAPVLFVILLAALAAVCASMPLDLGFLSVHSVDEYAFHGSLLNMRDGVAQKNIQNFFAFGFYNYGFGFFVLNLAAAFPFLGSDSAWSIYMPRLVTAVTALFGLFYIYRLARLRLGAWASCLLVLLVVSMPGFWFNATWFHPDWLMTTCLLASIFYFARNEEQPGTDYWRGVFAFGLAVGLGKFQALTFLPFVLAYNFRDEAARLDFSNFWPHLKRSVVSVAAVLGMFVVLNPYLVHPTGRLAFTRALDGNLASNATGHGRAGAYTLAEKLQDAVFDYYLHPVLCAALAVLVLYWCIDYFRSARPRSYHALGFFCLVYAAYLLVNVNKNWQSYYLVLMVPAVLLVVPLLAPRALRTQLLVLGALVLFQGAYYFGDYRPLLTRAPAGEPDNRVAEQHHGQISRFIETTLAGRVSPTTGVLLSPNTGFPFSQLHLGYRNVDLIQGPLSRPMFDASYIAQAYPDPPVRARKLAQFRTKDYIILRKDDIYFSREQLAQTFDKARYGEAVGLIRQFDSGMLGYRRLAQNEDVVIYERIGGTDAPAMASTTNGPLLNDGNAPSAGRPQPSSLR